MKWLVDGEEHEFEDLDVEIRIDGDRLWVRHESGWRSAGVTKIGSQIHVSFLGHQYVLEPVRRTRGTNATSLSGEIRAPMPGLLVAVNISQGEKVRKGQGLIVLEAMKTQITLAAPFDGTVEELAISLNQQVKSDQVLAILK